MGILESTVAKDTPSRRNPAPKESYPYLFYDVYKNSVGLITGNDVKQRMAAKRQEEVEEDSGPAGNHRQRPPIPEDVRAHPSVRKMAAGTVGRTGTFRGSPVKTEERVCVRNNNQEPDKEEVWVRRKTPPELRGLEYTGMNDENCNYTCHQECSSLVTLNCKTQTTELGQEFFEVKCENLDSPLFAEPPFIGLELKQKIEKYNSCEQGYEMEMQGDGKTFHGFIRVHMNLTRPINVLAGTRPPSIYDIIYEEEDNSEKTLTSFYLPRDTVKALHVTSETTTQGLIRALLQKFKVVDNPHKFCLYEKYWECEGSMKGVLRRLLDDEKPLWLVLAWGIDGIKQRKLVLQENDTGDILWDAFTVPELNNFLRILDREEEEYLNQLRLKYKKIQEKLTEAMENCSLLSLPESYEDPYTNM